MPSSARRCGDCILRPGARREAAEAIDTAGRCGKGLGPILGHATSAVSGNRMDRLQAHVDRRQHCPTALEPARIPAPNLRIGLRL